MPQCALSLGTYEDIQIVPVTEFLPQERPNCEGEPSLGFRLHDLGHNRQWDFGVRKIFRVHNVQYSAQADIFNLNNSSRVSAETQALVPSLGRPTAILQPRLLRLAVQMRF